MSAPGLAAVPLKSTAMLPEDRRDSLTAWRGL